MACVVIICGLLWYSNKNHSSQGGLEFQAEDLDLGLIQETQTVESTVRVKNTTSGKLKLLQFGTSCECLEVEPKQAEFEPGETKSFRLLIKGDVDADAVVDEKGIATKSIQLGCIIQTAANEKSQLATAILTVKIAATMKIDPGKYDFGSVSTRTGSLTAFVSVKQFDGADRFRVQDHPEWKIEVKESKGKESKLLLTNLHPQKVRMIRDTINVIPLRASGTELPLKYLRLTGSLEEEIQTQHKMYHAGRVKLQEEIQEIVVLHSLAGSSFKAKLKSAPSDVRVECLRDSTFQIDFKGTQLGEQQVSIVFAIEYDDKQLGEKVVQLQYYGETP